MLNKIKAMRFFLIAYLKRFPALRKLYARLFDRERYQQFAVTDWMTAGPTLLSSVGIKQVLVTQEDIWVQLANRLELRYVTEIPGAGVEPRIYRGAYEPAITDLILRELDDDSVFFDIGANIGWFSLHVAQAYPGAVIHAFEPGKFAFFNLSKNVAHNGYRERILLNHAAVSDHGGTEFFTSNQIGHALNHLVRSETTLSSTATEVTCTTLDTYSDEQKITRIDLIKCDVEGAELLVLKGGESLLKRFQPKLMLEVSPEWMARFGHTPLQLWTLLQDHGYDYQVIAEDGSRTCSRNFANDVGHGANVFFYPG